MGLDILDEKEKIINPRMSYSKISRFDREGPKALVSTTKLTGAGISKGKLVDKILNGEDLKEFYYIFDGTKPTATLGLIADEVVNWDKEKVNKAEILKYVRKCGYWASIKDDEKVALRYDIKDFWGYVNSVVLAEGKTVISSLELSEAMEIVSVLKTHEFTKHHFTNDFENIYQFKVEFKYMGFNMLGYVDLLTIDHKNKVIYVKDLKTGGDSSLKFQDSFLRWRYYLQSAIYILGINAIKKEMGWEDYVVNPFQFVFIGVNERKPLTYVVTQNWHHGAIHGFDYKGYTYRGLNELLSEISWHSHHKLYDFPMGVYEQKGILNLNDNFLTINEEKSEV